MVTSTPDLLAPLHRISVEQYERMGEAGVFPEGVRVELIEGLIVEMSPIGTRHMWAVAWLNRHVTLRLADTHIAWPQQGIRLLPLESVPEPDLAIVEISAGIEAPPTLVIEVANTSLAYDRITKGRLYARHGVTDYWIVNVSGEAVEVHRGPADDGFWSSRTVHAPGETLTPLAFPTLEVDIAELFAFVAANAGPGPDDVT